MRRQSGYIFHNKSSWFVRYMDDVLEDGAIVRRLVCQKIEEVSYGGEYRTRKSVQPFVDKILGPVNEGALDPRSTQMIVKFVDDTYIPRYVDVELRPASQKQFKDTWENHLKPRLGQQTLRSFRTVDAQRILDAIAGQGTLGKSSMKHCKSALSGIFKESKRLGVIDGVNPVADTRIGKTREVEEDTHAYSLAEVKAMLAKVGEPARTVVLTAAFSGLRRSEILGLRWADFDGATITVRRSHWNGLETDPKTKKSRAPIPVVKVLAEALAAHKLRQGVLAQDALPIFQAGNGKPLNLPNLARRVIKPAIERCIRCQKPASDHKPDGHAFELDKSVAWHGWHAFRRGLATNLHALAVDDKTIQAILRHSNVNLTMNTYVKTVAESQVNALDALSQKFETYNELATPSNGRPN